MNFTPEFVLDLSLDEVDEYIRMLNDRREEEYDALKKANGG